MGEGEPFHESGTGSLSTGQGTLVASHISQTPPAARSAGRAVLIGLAIVALALAAGVVLVLVVKAPTPPRLATDGAVHGERVKLSVTFSPRGAVARLDGVPLTESPFVAQVPRDGSMHRLDVEGPGLKSETRMVSYEKDILLDVTLAAAPEPQAANTAPSTTAAVVAVDAGKRPAGDGPARTRTPKREIDEKDPYKK